MSKFTFADRPTAFPRNPQARPLSTQTPPKLLLMLVTSWDRSEDVAHFETRHAVQAQSEYAFAASTRCADSITNCMAIDAQMVAVAQRGRQATKNK